MRRHHRRALSVGILFSTLWLLVGVTTPGFGCEKKQPEQSTASKPAATSVTPGTSVSIAPKFVPGRVSVYEHQADIVGSNHLGDLVLESKRNSTLVMRLKVESVDPDGIATLSMTYDSFKTTVQSGIGPSYAFDSAITPAGDSDPATGAVFRLMKDVKITATVAPTGKVLTLVGNEDLFNAMVKVETLQGRAGEFSTEGLKQVVEAFWLIGTEPRTAVSVGESWEDRVESPWMGNGKLIFVSAFKVLAAADKTVTLDTDVSATLECDFSDPPLTSEGIPDPAFPLNATLETPPNPGTIVWDCEHGQLLEKVTRLYYTLTSEQRPFFEGQENTINVQIEDVKVTMRRIASE